MQTVSDPHSRSMVNSAVLTLNDLLAPVWNEIVPHLKTLRDGMVPEPKTIAYITLARQFGKGETRSANQWLQASRQASEWLNDAQRTRDLTRWAADWAGVTLTTRAQRGSCSKRRPVWFSKRGRTGRSPTMPPPSDG